MKFKKLLVKLLLLTLAAWLVISTTTAYLLKKKIVTQNLDAVYQADEEISGGLKQIRLKLSGSPLEKRQQIPNKTVDPSATVTTPANSKTEIANFTGHDEESSNVMLDDIFMSVKTSGKYHGTRIDVLLKTWWKWARNQTYIFTDTDDERLRNLTGGHIINTKCGKTHSRKDLCCKMGQEYDAFIESNRKWWCHFDDDNYVNVDALLQLLRRYDWKSDVYLGKPSLSRPIEASYLKQRVQFWFATGGAGICISRRLGEKMSPWCRDGELLKTCNILTLPDDCTIGFVINNRLEIELTRREEFNSHLQMLSQIGSELLLSQVTLSYHTDSGEGENVINLAPKSPLFSSAEDRTRLLSFHCLLHPMAELCLQKRRPKVS